MNARSPHLDATIFHVEDEVDHGEDGALEHHEIDTIGNEPGEAHALREGGLRAEYHFRARVHDNVRARVKPRPVLKVVGGIWRTDPPLVRLAVDITKPVDPNAEIESEILQRHQVVAANLVFR